MTDVACKSVAKHGAQPHTAVLLKRVMVDDEYGVARNRIQQDGWTMQESASTSIGEAALLTNTAASQRRLHTCKSDVSNNISTTFSAYDGVELTAIDHGTSAPAAVGAKHPNRMRALRRTPPMEDGVRALDSASTP